MSIKIKPLMVIIDRMVNSTENNWLVIPLVFCQNRSIDELKKALLSGLDMEAQEERFNLDN